MEQAYIRNVPMEIIPDQPHRRPVWWKNLTGEKVVKTMESDTIKKERVGEIFPDATRRSRIETRQRRHKSLWGAGDLAGPSLRRQWLDRPAQRNPGIAAVLKPPRTRERVCILNERRTLPRRNAEGRKQRDTATGEAD